MKSDIFKNTLFIVLIFVLAGFISQNKAFAQQTIITVPSSDVLPEGGFILKTSVKNQINEDGYTDISPTAIFGIGHGCDFSLKVPVKINQDYNTSIKGDIGIKKVFFIGSSNRFTIGGSVAPSFNHSVTPDMFTYAHFTKKIRKTRTSLTAGGYLNGRNHFLNQG